MDKLKQRMFEWLVLGAGIWVAVSPIFLGSAGTIVFYGNVATGVFLIVIALRELTNNGKKI
jgi:hypothetical protein